MVIDPLRQEVQRLEAEEQRSLAGAIAALVAPYGSLAPEVVSPEEFRSMLERLLAGLRDNDLRMVRSVQGECQANLDRYDEEPPDNGFFALGAVVALYYATQASLEDAATGSMHAVMRLLDLVGAADDDGVGTGLYDEAYGWVREGRTDADRNVLGSWEIIGASAR